VSRETLFLFRVGGSWSISKSIVVFFSFGTVDALEHDEEPPSKLSFSPVVTASYERFSLLSRVPSFKGFRAALFFIDEAADAARWSGNRKVF
jgi:hypothetical protein